MRLLLACLSLCFIVCPFANSLSADDVTLDPAQPYSAERSNPVTYDVDFQVVVTAPYKTKLLRVWMPIPQSDRAQELLSTELSTFPEEIAPKIANEPMFGNRFAYFEFSNPQGGKSFDTDFAFGPGSCAGSSIQRALSP